MSEINPHPFQQQARHRLRAGPRLLGQPGGQALHGPRGLAVRRRAGQEEEVTGWPQPGSSELTFQISQTQFERHATSVGGFWHLGWKCSQSGISTTASATKTDIRLARNTFW